MPPRFFMAIATQYENLGDALIHRELVLLAAEHGPVLVEWSRCPPNFRRTLDLDGVANVRTTESRPGFFRAMLGARAAGRRAVLLLKPGAYLGPLGFGSGKAAAVLAFNRMLAVAGVELMQFGASYERLDAANLAFLRRKSALLAKHFVRDEQSLHYARENGLAVDGVLPDLAFPLFRDAVPPGSEPTPPLTLGLGFRTGQFEGQKGLVHALVRDAVAAIGKDNLAEVRLVAQVTWDLATMREIATLLEREFGLAAKVMDVHHSIAAAKAAYSGCDLVISNRLHTLLVAGVVAPRILACVDSIHNAKIVGLFESCGWTDNLLVLDRGERITAARLAQAMKAPIDGTPFADELRRGFAHAIFAATGDASRAVGD